MANHTDTLRIQLGRGPISARQLVENTGISQPTISRALSKLGDEIIRLGAGPSIRYTLRDSTRGFQSVPVFRVGVDGRIRELGTLVPVRPDGYVMIQHDGETPHSDGLPWWLFDMRPQGYLGRAYAARYATNLGLPSNPDHWSDGETIRALLAHGHDAIGNLLVGVQARDQFLNMPAPTPVNRETAFPALALAASAGETAGSSAGGEQPKFCTYTDQGHVIVKFTASDDNPITERWRDLLLAEHLALSVLGIETRLFDFAGQRFLEVPRFDRVGEFGRLGVFSLRALDAEFIGNATAPWPELVRRLATAGHVQTAAVAGTARQWAFGTLIGNTDMHAGNLSFISSEGRPYQLAPAYDVLPMAFAPRSGGAIVNTLSPANLTTTVPTEIWQETLSQAEAYLAKLNACDGFSQGFAPCLIALRQHVEEATGRICRLG